jgi:hypothetical protein
MTAPLTLIAQRLEKLLLMLSSSQPGEAVNAARAIGKTLQGRRATEKQLAWLGSIYARLRRDA